MKNMAIGLLFATCLTMLFVGLLNIETNIQIKNPSGGVTSFLSSVFFRDSVTELSLRRTYDTAVNGRGNLKGREKVKILIVPGHDREVWGTQFNGLKEVDLTLALGQKLYDLLKTRPAFDVQISQTAEGYQPALKEYFENNRQEIFDFIQSHKQVMESYVSQGEVNKIVNVEHNNAPTEVALRLYGINKWANENGIDIVIHIHFNDYPTRKRAQPGKYTGFSIYVPESQFSNAKGSHSVAKSVFDRLSDLYAPSNFPLESGGIVEDQELIAIGSHNTLDSASVLIEYGYIYEPLFTDPIMREVAMSDLATQTFLGITDFFGDTPKIVSEFGTDHLPYTWPKDIKKGEVGTREVLSLQAALMVDGVYPPPGENKNDCGLTAIFGPCTERSVKIFQEKHGISPVTGVVGESTRAKLTELYGY